MASTKELRTRIKSISNTAKVTGAMQMIAASKLRKAQNSAEISICFLLDMMKLKTVSWDLLILICFQKSVLYLMLEKLIRKKKYYML